MVPLLCFYKRCLFSELTAEHPFYFNFEPTPLMWYYCKMAVSRATADGNQIAKEFGGSEKDSQVYEGSRLWSFI